MTEIKPKRKRSKPGDRHYINNKEFYADMVAWDVYVKPVKAEFEALKKDAANNIIEGMIEIESLYQQQINDGVSFSDAKFIYEQACSELKDDNQVVSWYDMRPQIPDAIAKKIMLICQRLKFKPNFINYSYADEMVLDALLICVKYCDKFNVDKSENPFSYFTTVANNAFVARILKEAKQFQIKTRFVQQSSVNGDDFVTQVSDSSNSFENNYRGFLRNFYDIELPSVEKKERKKRASKYQTNVLPL